MNGQILNSTQSSQILTESDKRLLKISFSSNALSRDAHNLSTVVNRSEPLKDSEDTTSMTKVNFVTAVRKLNTDLQVTQGWVTHRMNIESSLTNTILPNRLKLNNFFFVLIV